MLFWMWIILFVVGFLIGMIDGLESIGAGISTFSLIAFLIACIILICNYAGLGGYIAKMETRHDTLVYQYENDIYDNDNDLGKRELMVDIQRWNEDLADNQKNQHDFWIGIYIPNIYDLFEPIELK